MNCNDDNDFLVDESVESKRGHDDKHHVEMLDTEPSSNLNDEFIHSHQKESSLVELELPQKKKRHGARNQHKMKYFVQWIHETFLNDTTPGASTSATTAPSQPSPVASSNSLEKPQHYILDVAGGKGELAARLVMCCKRIHVTMVDPRLADIATVHHNWILPKLPKKWQEQYFMKYNENKNFVHDILKERYVQLPMYFTTESVNGTDFTLRNAIEKCTLMIGMHADSATECIVDMALQYHKPFVVVPCCVFPNLFTQRFLTVRSDETNTKTTTNNAKENVTTTTTMKVPVRTYEQFCEYLYQKDVRFQRTVLPFDGRNIAIWWDGT